MDDTGSFAGLPPDLRPLVPLDGVGSLHLI